MKFKFVCVVVVGLIGIGIALAQVAKPRELHLRGDRFKPLTYEQLNPAQKTLIEHVLAGPRTSLDGPFNILLRSPEMGDLLQQVGAYARFHTSIPKKLNEFAILITARSWNVQEEWHAHHLLALAAGLDPAKIEAVSLGKRPANMDSDEAIVYNFATELLRTKHVSDATFAALKEKFGERGVVDLTATIGYFELVAGLLNTDRYPLAEGVKYELKPLH